MSGANLTREEARQRAEAIAVQHYDIAIDLTAGAETFGSSSTVSFTATPGTSTFVEFSAAAVDSVVLNGRALSVADCFDGHRIALPDLLADNTATIVGTGNYSNTGEGLHRFVDPVDNEVYLYTQFESADAKRMFACFDQPDLKATYALTVTAPAHWQVVSNSPTPVPHSLDDGRAIWAFPTTARMSTYITALVAGAYHRVDSSYTGAHGTYPMGVFCRASLAEYLDADDILDITKAGFELFEKEFATAYPFGKYDQLFVPEFNAGAMENAGCVTFHEDFVFRSRVTDAAYEQRSNTILHELAHMWFGNLVTMQWWDDLWLNESFAEWASHFANVRATRYTDAWSTFCNLRKAWAYRQDQLPSTHPIAADMVDLDSVRVNFDGITYAKGASALRQLVAWVGEENFLVGLREYFRKHAWGNTQLRDLLVELTAASGRDLSDWTRQWLETSGVNTVRPQFTVDATGRFATFAVEQLPPLSPVGVEPALRSHRLGIGCYTLSRVGSLEVTHRYEVDITGASTTIDELIGTEQPDLLLLNDGDLTFAKVRLDPKSAATAAAHLGQLSDPLARAVLWGAVWDMTRDAEMPTRQFVDLVLGAVPAEASISVVQQALRQVRAAIDQYADPQWRPTGMHALAEALHQWLRDAEPGSDRQLTFARNFASAASTPEQLDLVAALLDGSEVLDGLVMDVDLRWALVQRLASAGRASAADIDRELARDNTATGQRMAAMANASRPEAQAKADAWLAMTTDNSLPNAVLGAMIGGFQHPDQVALTQPFVDRYFEVAASVWSSRTHEMAQDIVTGLFPVYSIDADTVAKADAFLARDDIEAPVRRLVGEGRDSTARALRARACDAAAGQQ